jgi:AcrR family transcriptional regulator
MKAVKPIPRGGEAHGRLRNGPRTRQQILDLSLRLFSQRGFASTTVRDIARNAGITDAAIYYHFNSKRELMEALVEERGFISSIQQLESVSADYPLRQTLIIMARIAINLMVENDGFLRLILLESLVGDEVASQQYRRLVDLWQQSLASALRRYVEKGQLKGDSPEAVARHIISLILAAFVEEALLGRHRTPGDDSQGRHEALATFVTTSIDHILPSLRP